MDRCGKSVSWLLDQLLYNFEESALDYPEEDLLRGGDPPSEGVPHPAGSVGAL